MRAFPSGISAGTESSNAIQIVPLVGKAAEHDLEIGLPCMTLEMEDYSRSFVRRVKTLDFVRVVS